MMIIIIVSIVCASIFGHVEPIVLGVKGIVPDVPKEIGILPSGLNETGGNFLSLLNEDEGSFLSGLIGGVTRAIGLTKPNPDKISKLLLQCLYGEFELLAKAAVPVVEVVVTAVLLLCGCGASSDFYKELAVRVGAVLHGYAVREANICNGLAIAALKEANKGGWNILVQGSVQLKLFSDLNAKLLEGVILAIQSTVDVIIPYLPCNERKDECEKLLRSLLKLFYDRVGLAAATVTTANLLYILLGLPGCMKITSDLMIPLPI